MICREKNKELLKELAKTKKDLKSLKERYDETISETSGKLQNRINGLEKELEEEKERNSYFSSGFLHLQRPATKEIEDNYSKYHETLKQENLTNAISILLQAWKNL